MRKSIITCILLLCLGNSYLVAAAEPNIEQLFKGALNTKGKDYVELRQKILNILPQNDSYIKEQSKSSDLKTRIIAQAILERAAKPQEYQYFEELMIVPITMAVKQGAETVSGARPFQTIKSITKLPYTSNSLMVMAGMEMADMGMFGTQSNRISRNYCHDDSAFLFLAEMALKDTMYDVPELSEQIEWTDEQKTYTPKEAAEMLEILPQTAEKWHKEGLFHTRGNIRGNRTSYYPLNEIGSINSNSPITQLQIRYFYEYFSDKIINPEYLKSTQTTSRVTHSDAIYASQQFQQDSGILFRCYAVLMLRKFDKPETPELLSEIFKVDISEQARLFCVEGFLPQTQVEQIRQAMKAVYMRAQPIASSPEIRTGYTSTRTNFSPEKSQTNIVPSLLIRKAAFIKSRENPEAFTVSDYIEAIIPGNDEFNLEIAKILGEEGDEAAIEPLIEMLGGSSSINRSIIAQSILGIDPNSMYKALEHEDSRIRESAWVSIASSDVNFPLELGYLIKHLDDDIIKMESTRNPMLYSIMELISKDYPDLLKRFLDSANTNIRKRALDILVYNPEKYLSKESPSIKELLLSYVHDENYSFRRAVLSKLKKYVSDEEVYDVFLDALKDSDFRCRIEAIGSLDDYDETLTILETLLSQEKHPSVRNSVVNKLSKNKEPSRYRIFVTLISDEDSQVRRIVAQELSDWGDEQVIDLMKLLLNDSDSMVQRTAITYIAKNDIKLLKEVIPTVGPKLRQTAYNSLEEVKTDEAIDLLIEGTKDENADVQEAAIRCLAKQKYSKELDDPVVLAVRKCLSDDNTKTRYYAMVTLYEMVGDKSFEIITGYLYDSDASIKKQAIRMLVRFNNPEVLERLMEVLEKEEDKETLVELVRALQNITGNLLTKDEWMQWWGENKDTYLQ